jgi:hypothetical protein
LLPFLGFIVIDVGVPLLLPLTIPTLHDSLGFGLSFSSSTSLANPAVTVGAAMASKTATMASWQAEEKSAEFAIVMLASTSYKCRHRQQQ